MESVWDPVPASSGAAGATPTSSQATPLDHTHQQRKGQRGVAREASDEVAKRKEAEERKKEEAR